MAEAALTESGKFKQVVPELETDDDPERFKERWKKIAAHQPVEEKPE